MTYGVGMHHVDLGLLVLRVGFGLFLAFHGYNKLFGKGGIQGTIGWFSSIVMKPPKLNAYMAAGTEIAAGVGFAAGLLTPLCGGAIIALMVVAIVVAHRKNGFFIFNQGQGWEYCASIAIAAFALSAIGAGQWSIDHALKWDVQQWWGAGIAAGVGLGGSALQLAACYRPAPPKG
jgi:putative oxidoreductase